MDPDTVRQCVNSYTLTADEWLHDWFAHLGASTGIGVRKGGWLSCRRAIIALQELVSLQNEMVKQFE